MSNEIYVRLTERLNQFDNKVPPVNAFYQMLEMAFTQEEAQTAALFPQGSLTIGQLAAYYKKEEGQLSPLIETMADKGHIFVLKGDNGDKIYEMQPWFPGVIEFSILRFKDNPEKIQRWMALEQQMYKEADELVQGLAPDMEALKSMLPKPQVRTVVIDEDITADKKVYSYESLLEIVEKEESFGAMPCCCRETADRRNDPCKHTEIPKYSCLNFGHVADYVVERGFGIRITKDECKAIIKTFAEAGVVFNSNNFTEGVQYVCGCCGCCCGILRRVKEVGNLNMVEPSNFICAVDNETCIGCAECVDRCPVEAISLADEIANVDPDKCLGCGACISICPEESLSLQRRSEHKPEIGDRIFGLGYAVFLDDNTN